MRIRDTRLIVALGAILFAVPSFGGEPVVATDLLRIRSVSMIDVARDGSRAVYVVHSFGPAAPGPDVDSFAAVTEFDADAGWTSYSHLYLVDLEKAGVAPRRLTWGTRRDHSPRLSPDGRSIAFVRIGDVDEMPQIWLLAVDGGEARVVTDMDEGAGDPRWSSDGTTLLFSSSVPVEQIKGTPPWPNERWARDYVTSADDDTAPLGDPDGDVDDIRAWLAASAKRGTADVITRLRFQGEHELRGPMSISHLFVIDLDDPTLSPRQVTHGFVAHTGGRWLPGRAAIVCTRQRDPSVHPDLTRESAMVALDLDPDATAPAESVLMDEPGWSLFAPSPSLGGNAVAFLASARDEPTFMPTRLGVVELDAGGLPGSPFWLTSEDGFDVSVRDFAWMPSRSALVFSAARGGGSPLFTMGLGLIEPVTIVDRADGQPIGVDAFGVGGGAVVYAVTHPRNPSVLRVRSARGDRLLEDLNPWLLEKDLAEPVEATVERADGTLVQYWTMEPPAREDHERVPVVVEIHGGPHGMWGPGESTMWHEFQLLCAQGYAVAYANPRGSDGYGTPYRRTNEQDWGDGPGGDVLAMADEVAVLDWIDRDRMVVTGGSYGGYLTAWIVAHDHRFKAAVAQRGVYDLATFFGEGNAWDLVPREMGGHPWDSRTRPVLTRESPISDVHRIRTPLLIMHASDDLRTGVSQSEMLYRALKVLGRPVEYVRYPDAGHDLSRTGLPAQRLDRLNRIIEFFDRGLNAGP